MILLIACNTPDASPPDFDAALRALVASHGADQATIDAAAADFLATVDDTLAFDGSLSDRSAIPAGLTVDDVASFDRPDRDPAAMLGVVVGRLSPYKVDEQWSIQTMDDQRPVEPYCPQLYTRTFLEGGDCWYDGCAAMATSNDMIKENLVMKLAYQTRKDFHTFGDAGGYIAWSWTPEEAFDEAGNDGVLQSFTVDIWAPRDDGAIRVGALWSENLLSIATSDEVQISLMMSGTDRIQRAGDEFLAEAE